MTDDELAGALADGWGTTVRSISYLPVGFGSYHWSAEDAAGRSWFVTVDDLAKMTGDGTREVTFDLLGRALGTTLALRRDAGLDFVVAPVPDRSAAPVRRLAPRYALSVYPMLDGEAGRFGPHRPEDQPEMFRILAELHRATPTVASLVPRAELRLPGRERLVEALGQLDRPWTGGPYAESARQLLADRADHVARLLVEFDRLVGLVEDRAGDWVVTHGEPHPGNVVRVPAGLRLVDWETVRLAPPERDLWMLADDPDEVAECYRRVTGRAANLDGIALYRLWWELADIASYVGELSQPHQAGEDTASFLSYLRGYLRSASG